MMRRGAKGAFRIPKGPLQGNCFRRALWRLRHASLKRLRCREAFTTPESSAPSLRPDGTQKRGPGSGVICALRLSSLLTEDRRDAAREASGQGEVYSLAGRSMPDASARAAPAARPRGTGAPVFGREAHDAPSLAGLTRPVSV